MVKEKVLKTIEEHNLIEKNQHIVLGLSGGPDSVCLFHILKILSKEMNLIIHPVHINHKFRPGAAESDQKYVENLCLREGCTCRTFVFDCAKIATEKRITSEEAGRLVRYQSFAEVACQVRNSGVPAADIKIAVAQNADDQAETILFRILRGTGTDGLSGISYDRTDGEGNHIIRPLLDVSKKDIVDYCSEEKLNPCIDHTNLAPIYTRNKIRLNLIPYLEKEFNSNLKESIIRLGKTASQDKDFLQKEARRAFDECVLEKNTNAVIFDGSKLRNLHPAVRQRSLSLAMNFLNLNEDMTYIHFCGCEKIIFNDKPSARMDLPGGYITKLYNNLKLSKNSDECSNMQVIRHIMTREEYEEKDLKPKEHCAFDLEQLQAVYGEKADALITLRTRRAGDHISIAEDSSKKIQNFFVDAKVPKDERDKIPLLCINHEVLWVVNSRYSGKYKVNKTTKNVICIELFVTI